MISSNAPVNLTKLRDTEHLELLCIHG